MAANRDRAITLDAFPPHTREAADALAKAASAYLDMLSDLRERSKGQPGSLERELRARLAEYLRTG